MAVVHQTSQAAKKLAVEKRVEGRPWSISYKRTSMPLFATLLLATLVSSTVNSTMVLILFLSLHLLHPARNLTSPLPPLLPSPLPSPPLLLPSLNPTNHHIGGQGQSRSHRNIWVSWTSDSDWSRYGWVHPSGGRPHLPVQEHRVHLSWSGTLLTCC